MKTKIISLANDTPLFLFILSLILIVCLLSSCVLPKVTVSGQYGDYSFMPRQAIKIEDAKGE